MSDFSKTSRQQCSSLLLLALLPLGTACAAEPSNGHQSMQKVVGIGGLFFRSQDPAATAKWYAEVLGVDQTPTSYDTKPWHQQAGPTVFAPFSTDTEYFGAINQQWMINFRVIDLDAMVAQVRASGTPVEVDPQDYPNGRFARLQDPDGNPIQLWEPKDPTSE